MRGAPSFTDIDVSGMGIIPACAGSTLDRRVRQCRYWDHPRMCGEHISRNMTSLLTWGSSPHVRGARRLRRLCDPQQGIIPACAGSTMSSMARFNAMRDHPRMCGEHIYAIPQLPEALGSSPHVRGALTWCRSIRCQLGIIPACAGSTRYTTLMFDADRDHPRMCGEHTSKIA